jgi:glycosyltransferase involved in cell wall biosynthesis
MMGSGKPRLLIVGVHPVSDGYPNVRFRVEGLHRSACFSVTEINTPVWKDELHHSGSVWCVGGKMLRGIHAHLSVLAKYLVMRHADRLYVPYPAVFVVFLLSLLPRRLQPRYTIMDAFISLYDTVVIDRKYLSVSSWPARMLRMLEKRALTHADLVITDTPQNSRYLCKLYGLDKDKVTDLPLATDERHFYAFPEHQSDSTCTVLFIGTLVPLHGIETILAAIENLCDRPDIRFRVIGDGQMSPLLEEFVSGNRHPLEWIRSWQSSAKLAEEIRKADICLGIFGNGAKAHRVCPLKLYMYAACGKAVITGDSEWARDATDGLEYIPFRTSRVGSGVALADQIRELADSSGLRSSLSVGSRKFYVERLSNRIGLERLEALIEIVGGRSTKSVPTKQDHEFE